MSTWADLARRRRELSAQLPHLPRAWGLVWEAARGWTVAWASLLLVQGLLPVALVYLTRALVDALVAAMETRGAGGTLQPVLLYVALFAAVLLLGEALRGLTSWIRAVQAERVQDHISGLIHRQSLAVDLAFYEAPDYYDHLHRARLEASHRPTELVENAGSMAQNAVTLIAMAAVLLPYGWWLPMALVASTLPALWVVLHYSSRMHLWRRRTTPRQRHAWYYDWLVTSREAAPEMRLFGLGSRFAAGYQDLRREIREERLELERKQNLAEVVAGGFGLLVTGIVLAWMAWRAMGGGLTLGDLALFYQAFNQGQRLMRTMLQNVGQIYGSILFLGDLFEFLSLRPSITSPPEPRVPTAPVAGAIRFRDVTFSYPGSERRALDRFDLMVEAGQTAAIVGSNGAGKSTLIKLVTRLYDPEMGTVEMDGVDLRELDLDMLRRAITVLFQEPVHYNATAAQNIELGDLGRQIEADERVRAAHAAGADEVIRRLPRGYETVLGRWFAGGNELSVGEWQRIALARAFVRAAPIVLLDEPTSAMDSWAESDWLDRLAALTEGRTVVLVTHRFTTAMRADVIHVMDEGRIVESGTHRELMEREGRYAKSWSRQMQDASA